MVVDKFEVPRKQIISDLGGKHGAGQHPELALGMEGVLTAPRCLAGLSRSVGLSIHAQLKAMTYAALADLQDRAGGRPECDCPRDRVRNRGQSLTGEAERSS